ncbi:UNVERIFIED_CONTAM: hypothetical protein K2H54_057730 [Gekko kuhli]
MLTSYPEFHPEMMAATSCNVISAYTSPEGQETWKGPPTRRLPAQSGQMRHTSTHPNVVRCDGRLAHHNAMREACQSDQTAGVHLRLVMAIRLEVLNFQTVG